MFKLVSNYQPTGDQPQAIEYLSKRNTRRKKISDVTWCYRLWKNLHNGKYNSKGTKTNFSFSP